MDEPIAPEILEPLLAARRALIERDPGAPRRGALLGAGRGSPRLELRRPVRELSRARRRRRFPHRGARLLGGAVGARARCATWRRTISIPPIPRWPCWSSRWSPRARRRRAEPRRPTASMLINATWGLGSSIAQGEVAPDRYVLSPGRQAARSRHRLQAADARGGCAHLRKPCRRSCRARPRPASTARRPRSSARWCAGPRT